MVQICSKIVDFIFMISVHTLTFNAFEENTYVVCDEQKNAVIIDPGCYEDHEKDYFRSFISDNNLQVMGLLNTHCHIDHVLGNAMVSRLYNVPLHIYPKEQSNLAAVLSYSAAYGFPEYEAIDALTDLSEEQDITFGEMTFKVLWLPGHTAGHVAFINEKERICLSGDVLFSGSIGRTDLPGGDYQTLINSIQKKMFKYPDDLIVYPGHGPSTRLEHEKQFNPFCALQKND